MEAVVIWAGSNLSWLWASLAEKLRAETGARVSFVCNTELDVGYFKAMDVSGAVADFTTVNRFFHLYDDVDEDEESIIRRARKNESKYGVLVTDLLQVDRHLGLGFSPLGSGHPRSRLNRKASYLKSIHFFNRVMDYWENYLNERRPDLIVNPAGTFVGKGCAVVARARAIPIRHISWSRYQEYFYWAFDELEQVPYLRTVYDSIPPETHDGPQAIVRNPKAEAWREDMIRRKSVLYLLWLLGRSVLYESYRKLRRVTMPGNYLVTERWKSMIRTCLDFKRLNRCRLFTMGDLKGKDFVFYPLHTEPEISLSLLSPEFNEQLAIIHLIAKNLPAGVTLAVKEHLHGIGRRPGGLYRSLEQIPNVVMASPYENAVELAKLSKCAIVITGTLGLEAAALGVPVISFSQHNIYDFVPHAHVVISWMELRELLSSICLGDDPQAKERRGRDGARLLHAIRQISFDLSGIEWSHGMGTPSKKKRPSPEEVDRIFLPLMESLQESMLEDLGTGGTRVATRWESQTHRAEVGGAGTE